MTEFEWLSRFLKTEDVVVLKSNYNMYKRAFTFDVTPVNDAFNTSSKGNQRKWFLPQSNTYIKEELFYRNKRWQDYLCEVISSELFLHFNFDMPVPFVDYNVCYIKCSGEETVGCISKNFMTPTEEFISFRRLLDRMQIDIRPSIGFEELWNLMITVLSQHVGYNVTDELTYMFIVDFLMGNQDRHMNNFGVCRDWITNKYTLVPLFDTGMSLLQASESYDVTMRPFGIRSLDCIQEILKRNPILWKLPDEIDVTRCSFPSEQSLEFFVKNAEMLNINVCRGSEYDIFRKFRWKPEHCNQTAD